MYLNLVQIAESFGVSENVVEGWVRDEGLPSIPDRGRLLFDRAQVANWAATRGLAAQAGFLAPAAAAHASGWHLEALLRAGGIWRDVAPADVPATLARIVGNLQGVSAPVKQLVAQRLQAPGGITLAPVGSGFALPHPSARIALGREAGLVALLTLSDTYPTREATPDDVPIRHLVFFVAPSPRAHLDLLGKLSRALTRGPLRELMAQGAADESIFQAAAAADAAAEQSKTQKTP